MVFTFEATPIKLIGLLVLFVWCVAWCTYELTRPQDARQRVSNALHLAMAVVMLLMVTMPTWSTLIRVIPIPVLAGFFGLATAWFGWLCADAFRRLDRRGGWHFATCTAMFLAMAWHLAAMAVMRGLRMGAGMEAMAAARRPGGVLWWFAVVGVPLMAYLLIATVRGVRDVLARGDVRVDAAEDAACACGPGCSCPPGCSCSVSHPVVTETGSGATVLRTVTLARTCHEQRPVGSLRYRLAALGDVAMNGGMFWMSTGILTPLLPFVAVFAF